MSYKKCTKCQGLVYGHEFDEVSETCHLCLELATEAKKAKRSEYRRRYREKNKEKLAAKARAYREANRDEIREYKKAYQKAYYKTEKGRAALKRALAKSHHKRRAAILNAPSDDWTREEIHEAYGGRCVYCSASITLDSMDADHYIPLSKGGSNLRSNIRCSCASCNRSKGNKMPEDFIGETL